MSKKLGRLGPEEYFFEYQNLSAEIFSRSEVFDKLPNGLTRTLWRAFSERLCALILRFQVRLNEIAAFLPYPHLTVSILSIYGREVRRVRLSAGCPKLEKKFSTNFRESFPRE